MYDSAPFSRQHINWVVVHKHLFAGGGGNKCTTILLFTIRIRRMEKVMFQGVPPSCHWSCSRAGGGVSLVLSMVLLGEQEGEVPRQDGGTPPQDSTTDRTGSTPLSR